MCLRTRPPPQKKMLQLGSFKTLTTVRRALVALSRLSPAAVHQSAETFPTVPCLVAEKHEHHVLLSVLVDLSQPRLVGGGGGREKDQKEKANFACGEGKDEDAH